MQKARVTQEIPGVVGALGREPGPGTECLVFVALPVCGGSLAVEHWTLSGGAGRGCTELNVRTWWGFCVMCESRNGIALDKPEHSLRLSVGVSHGHLGETWLSCPE